MDDSKLDLPFWHTDLAGHIVARRGLARAVDTPVLVVRVAPLCVGQVGRRDQWHVLLAWPASCDELASERHMPSNQQQLQQEADRRCQEQLHRCVSLFNQQQGDGSWS